MGLLTIHGCRARRPERFLELAQIYPQADWWVYRWVGLQLTATSQRYLVHWSLVIQSVAARLRLRTPHIKRPPGERDENDPRFSVAVLGVALLVLTHAFEVPAEHVPGHKLLPVPDDGRHEDDREDAGHEQDQPGAI